MASVHFLLIAFVTSLSVDCGVPVVKLFTQMKNSTFFDQSWSFTRVRSHLECLTTCSTDPSCLTYGFACKVKTAGWCCCITLTTFITSVSLTDSGWQDVVIGRLVSAKTVNQISSQVLYELTIQTGNELNAGTDADVYIDIFGTESTITRFHLDNPNVNDFGNGALDIYKFNASDVGVLKGIMITAEASLQLISLDWHCVSVIVRKFANQNIGVLNAPLGEHFFLVDRWLLSGLNIFTDQKTLWI